MKAVTKRPKVSDLPLNELYAMEKMTPIVVKNIIEKEDFTSCSFDYCEKVCKMPECMKNPNALSLYSGRHVDVVIIQDQKPRDDRWKRGMDIERMHQRQFGFIARSALGLDVSFTVLDLAKCQSRENLVKGKHKDPTATQKASCSPYLIAELNRIKPKVIISTSTAISAAIGVKGKTNYNNRGEFYMTNHSMLEEQVPVILTLHVAVLNMIRQNATGKMYGPDFFSVLKRDFAKAASIARKVLFIQDLKERVQDIRKKNIVVPITINEVIEWVNRILALPANYVISWDLETTSLDAWSKDARILTCQFGYRREDGDIQCVVFPLWHRDNIYFSADEAWTYIKLILLSGLAKVGHNVKFDTVFCAVTTGVRPVNVKYDTMLMLHSLNSGIQGNYGLKAAVWDYLPDTGLGGYEELLDETLDIEEMKRLIALEKAEFKEYSDEADIQIEEEADVPHDS